MLCEFLVPGLYVFFNRIFNKLHFCDFIEGLVVEEYFACVGDKVYVEPVTCNLHLVRIV